MQSSISIGTIIRAKIDHLFVPFLLAQVQAFLQQFHLARQSLRSKISQEKMFRSDFTVKAYAFAGR